MKYIANLRFSKLSCIIVILLTLGGQMATAQKVEEPDKRLSVVFSEKELDAMRDYSPLKVKWNNWIIRHSYEILTLEDAKLNELPPLLYFDYSKPDNCKKGTIGGEVQEIDIDNINIHEFYFIRNYDSPSIYRIGNTDKAIYFHSKKELTETFNLMQNEK